MRGSLAERPSFARAALDGALLGLGVWGLEAGAVVALDAGVGGLAVLRALADDLAAWGLAYALFGAAAGLLAPWLGRWSAVVPWLALVALADPSVAPRPVYLLLVALAAAGTALAPRSLRLRLGALAGFAVALGGLGAVGLGVVGLSDASSVRAPGPAALPNPADAAPAATPARARPHVILVVVDTLRADHVGAYGYPRATTPAVDALARDGMRFSRAWSTSSWTLPAHASLFTGLAPAAHGAIESHPHLDAGPDTLAAALARRGYRTLGLSANAWVSGGTGLDRGFARFAFLGDEGLVSQLLLPLVFARPADLGGRALTDAATAAIAEAAPGGAPLFLFVNYLEAHEPLGTLPEPARSRFSPTPLDPTLGRLWMRDMPRWWARCDADAGALACRDGLFRAAPDHVAAVVDRYDAGIAYADARIGELRAAVERAGIADDTLFVVTSDHGEHLGEDGRLGHMVWLDEALVAVPIVARYPRGLGAGTVDATPVDLAWLHDWILAVVDGAARPAARDPRAEVNPHAPDTIAAWEALYGADFTPAATPRRAVTDGTRSVWRDGDTVTAGPDRRPASAAEVAWVDGGAEAPGDTRGSADGGALPAAADAIDPATARALEAIGYVR